MSVLVLSPAASPSCTARYAEANPCSSERPWQTTGRYRAAVAATEQFGPEDLGLAGSLYRLAELHREVGEDSEAEPLLRRALEIQERALGPAHPHVALTLSSLMFLYRRQGKEPEANAAAARVHTILVTHARETAPT